MKTEQLKEYWVFTQWSEDTDIRTYQCISKAMCVVMSETWAQDCEREGVQYWTHYEKVTL